MRARMWFGILAVAALVFLVVSKKLTDYKIERAALDWVECEECGEAQLEAVRAFGGRAVPELGKFLLDGPPRMSSQRHRQHLIDVYQGMVGYVRKHPEETLRLTQKEYVGFYIDNYDLMYRMRSAQALARIGGPEAKGALLQAEKKNLGKRTSLAVRQALASFR